MTTCDNCFNELEPGETVNFVVDENDYVCDECLDEYLRDRANIKVEVVSEFEDEESVE